MMNAMPAAEVRTTTCYMCACRCGIRVHLQDGVVRYIDGNPDHPLNQGVICAKGSSGIMKQYSPARLSQPLRRKAGSERGAAQPATLERVPPQAREPVDRRRHRVASADPLGYLQRPR